MPRRLATLAILLFSLFGAVPAALACALAAGTSDCCAPDGSCLPDPSQAALTTSVACCDAQGTAQHAGISVSTKTERLKAFSSSFDHPDAISIASLGLDAAAARSPGHGSDARCLYPNQQQTYLLTARLRL